MTTSVAINFGLEAAFLALTPWERWSAARGLGDGSQSVRLVIGACVVALVVLLGLLCLVSIRRGKKVEKRTLMSFEEYARERGLSVRERQLVALIAHQAGLKQPESIFTIGSAFARGAARMLEEAAEGEHAAEASEQLKMEVAYLGEKLGFGGNNSASGDSGKKLEKVTTKNIPVGKKVYVAREKPTAEAGIEATIARNSDTELAVTLSQAVNVVFGEMWCVRYYSGSSVWEFDTKVVSYDGDTLALNHSEDVRFVNRRRFLRVSVRLRAFVARFPFTVGPENGSGIGGDLTWAPPRFVPGVVTEIAGPGLRFESSLEAEAGERVLVVLNLVGQSGAGSDLEGGGEPKVVESMGIVRYVKATERGYSTAVELTGLDDSEVDELIRATNAASLQDSERIEEIPVAAGQGV